MMSANGREHAIIEKGIASKLKTDFAFDQAKKL